MNLPRAISFLLLNWKTKLGSLIMAFFLFAYVQYSRNISRMIQVRVEPPGLSDEFILNGPVPAFMNVRLSGPKDLMDFPVRDLHIKLSNTRKKPSRGENTFLATLEPELPTGVSASYRVRVPVELDFVRFRRLPVVPEFELDLDGGSERGFTRVEPSSLTVRGPAEILNSMDRITTRKTKFHQQKRNVLEDTLIVDFPRYVTAAEGQPIEVKLFVRFLPAGVDALTADDPTVRRFDQLLVKCDQVPRGVAPVTFTAVAALVRLDALRDAEKLELEGVVACPVFFDEKEETIRPFREIQNLPVSLVSKRGLPFEVLRISPERIQVRFEREAANKRPRIEVKKGFEEHIFQ